MSWKEGQAPLYVWLSRKDVGAKKYKKTLSRLFVGNVKFWATEPYKSKEYVCYRLVPAKSKKGTPIKPPKRVKS